MTDYTELVKALRYCSHDGLVKCNECKYGGKEWPVGCEDEMMRDAADAIEALQAEQKKTVTQIFGEEQQEWEEYCTGLMNRIKELKAQLLKRGEWVLQASGQDCKCSVCESYWIPFGDEYDYKFCPNCGAKMEVQDG